MDGQQCNSLLDPDCVKCLRKKLRATAVAVFFRDESEWRIGTYQGEKPAESAEVEFYAMLLSGVPDKICSNIDGWLINDDEGLCSHMPSLAKIISGNCLIAAAVKRGDLDGARIAWRDNCDPFQPQDLETIRCYGNCPEE